MIGRSVVEVARARGHELTLVDRGRTAPDAFPELERVRAERAEALATLAGRRFDGVVDLAAFGPDDVAVTLAALGERIGYYLLVSSVSAYADLSRPGVGEEDELAFGRADYGGLKAGAERALAEAWPGPALVVRPGLVAGPGDSTGRFTYWPLRLVRGGDVLVPGPPERPIQYLDGRDLGEWLVRCVERRLEGTLNAVGPVEELSARELLETCREVTGTDARIVWVDPDALRRAGVEPWADVPLWSAGEFEGFMRLDGSRGWAAGLTTRPVRDTVDATLRWALANPDAFARPGLSPERERALLAELGARA